MRWELAVPKDFEKLKKEEICILPMGCLERHGEHMPFGTDVLIAHHIAVSAAEIEPCIVFPPYYFGQIHEAACFSGALQLPSSFLLKLFQNVCDSIAKNGFKKIVILNGHGGNGSMLNYFTVSNLDRKTDYSIYIIPMYSSGEECEETEKISDICQSTGDHAGEWETSLMMSVMEDSVRMDYHKYEEPINPKEKLKHLGRISSGFSWYSNYPENVMGCPSLASKEKGDKMMEIYINRLVRDLKIIKEDRTLPKLQKEFYSKIDSVSKKGRLV